MPTASGWVSSTHEPDPSPRRQRPGRLGAAARLAPLGELLVCDRRRADLADPEGLARLVRAERPQFIVNAGAYTAVDKPSDADNARLINARAVAVLAEAAACGAWLVHYSTDYVFDGAGSVPFAETRRPAR